MPGVPVDEELGAMTAALLRFRRPSVAMLDGIRDVLGRLPVCHPPRFRDPYTLERPTVRGTLDQILPELNRVLAKDFEHNNREAGEWSGSFDYVVMMSELLDGAVHINTRLYATNPETPQGSISYGRVVERVGPDEYLMWIDDDNE